MAAAGAAKGKAASKPTIVKPLAPLVEARNEGKKDDGHVDSLGSSTSSDGIRSTDDIAGALAEITKTLSKTLGKNGGNPPPSAAVPAATAPLTREQLEPPIGAGELTQTEEADRRRAAAEARGLASDAVSVASGLDIAVLGAADTSSDVANNDVANESSDRDSMDAQPQQDAVDVETAPVNGDANAADAGNAEEDDETF